MGGVDGQRDASSHVPSHVPPLRGGGTGRDGDQSQWDSPTVPPPSGHVDQNYAATREELDGRFWDSVSAAAARRHARDDLRRSLSQTRKSGLRRRHAARLARADQRLHDAQHDGPNDSWWEEPE